MQIQSYTSQLNNYSALSNSRKNKRRMNQEVSFGLSPADAWNITKKIPKKGYGLFTDGLAHTFGWIGSTKPMQKLVDALKDKNYAQHIAAFVGVVLSGFYMIDTAKSKKIEKDQKMPLIINQGAVAALSTAGAYTLDNYLDKKLEKFNDKFHIASMTNAEDKKLFLQLLENKENMAVYEEAGLLPKLKEKFMFKPELQSKVKKLIKKGEADETAQRVMNSIKNIAKDEKDKVGKATELFIKELENSKTLQKIFARKGFDTALEMIAETDKKLSVNKKGYRYGKSIMVFAMIYRFVAPVLATPIANAISDKLDSKKKAPAKA